ncbi:hypothetical protein LRK24_00555 [Rhodanobacter denitrificans]|uniref:hypothetical protein n=1 Tax=Rhodanobacter denitrificans TaxID=666685 RepID=UPI000AB5188D|nr:hypothetical protein [Rhodanobacter denitrificans]UJM90429.1 hypothetical protein LRK24_00555 [Rhodanobacter denitrificans]
MSYIVAFVKFPESESEYPVGCFRVDLKGGDEVVVRLADQRLRSAVVKTVQYLNWDCNSYIECKRSEATDAHDGSLALPAKSPVHIGLATYHALGHTLARDGWVPLNHYSGVYRIVYLHTNETQTSAILIRRNGVDIQLLSDKLDVAPKPQGVFETPLTRGRLVRHYLAHTRFNLFEGIYRFSKAFMETSGDYDRFFTPVGSRDKRTSKLKALSEQRQREKRRGAGSGMLDIYDAISDGSDGPAYLGDGMWLDSSGGLHDWRR